jgi:hypothetical protein
MSVWLSQDAVRISVEDANLTGIMLIDVEKKQLRTAPLGGEHRADDIENVAVTDKAILLHGTGIKQTDRTWSAVISLGNGQFDRWRIHTRFIALLIGQVHSPTLMHCTNARPYPRRPLR